MTGDHSNSYKIVTEIVTDSCELKMRILQRRNVLFFIICPLRTGTLGSSVTVTISTEGTCVPSCGIVPLAKGTDLPSIRHNGTLSSYPDNFYTKINLPHVDNFCQA